MLTKRPNPVFESTQMRRSKRLREALDESQFNACLPVDTDANKADLGSSSEDQGLMAPDTGASGTESGSSESESDSEEDDSVSENNIDPAAPVIAARDDINTEMLANFKDYALNHSSRFLDLTGPEETQIGLLDVLVRKRAPLNAYKEVLEWHLKGRHELEAHETLKHAPGYSNRTTIIKKLLKRFNLEGMLPIPKSIRLPFSRANVTIPCIDVQECIVSLLTDPRFDATDYLFFDEDPLQPPPEQVTWISDLNTGEAHLKTYEKLVTDPKRQVLLPIVMYIDGATTGQFSELPVTALKIALGIHNRSARDKPYAWRSIAFLPQVRKHEARGKRMLQDSGHLDSQDVGIVEGEGDEGDQDDSNSDSDSEAPDGAPKAQDLHSMLRVALKSFVKLQKTGFIWDLKYKNRIYKNIEFIIYVPFVKCDTEEGDLLSGKYLVRNENVAHLCRYCHCPTADADNPGAKYRLKTTKEIQKLVDRNDLVALQEISQHCIQNAFHIVRFHQANERGIHGATPSEMLHALLLGIFKYIRDIFFENAGKTGSLAEALDGLAKMYGKLLSRQSDRDLPHTNFPKGIRRGKLMAKLYRGVLLLIAAVLASTEGRKRLLKRKKFGGEQGLKDWVLLVELMLEWEAFLNEKRMKRAHVQRLAKKHRFIMYIMTVVAKRAAGMGLKLMKFHAIVHLVEDMLLYGVPTEFDTGSNESHHKPTKQAAKLTQRNESTFHMQTALRLLEFQAIELAVQEVKHGKRVCDYYDLEEEPPDPIIGFDDSDDSDGSGAVDHETNKPVQIVTGGTRLEVFRDEENDNEPCFRVGGRSKHADATKWVTSVVDFLVDLQGLIQEDQPSYTLDIFTEHSRDGVMFRGHPNHRGTGPWKDWVAACGLGRLWSSSVSHLVLRETVQPTQKP